MPIVQCKDLKYVVDHTTGGQHKLIAATYGRGLWIRDVPSLPVIYVDKGNTTGNEDGTLQHPFNTVGEGIGAAPPGGAIVAIRADTYQEPQMVTAKVMLVTYAGVTTIR